MNRFKPERMIGLVWRHSGVRRLGKVGFFQYEDDREWHEHANNVLKRQAPWINTTCFYSAISTQQDQSDSNEFWDFERIQDNKIENTEYPNQSPRVDQSRLLKLSTDQQQALECVSEGRNLFITGGAGSGKSQLLLHIRKHFEDVKVPHWVTAPTGLAATLINGMTINAWAGMGTAGKPWDYYKHTFKRIYHLDGTQKVKAHLDGTNSTQSSYNEMPPLPWALIIDEVSMVG